MNDFLIKLETVFEIERINIKMTDNFRNYESWDSIAMLTLMAMLQDEYNISISREEFEKITTINDLYFFIKTKS